MATTNPTTNPDPPANKAAAFIPLEANPELLTSLLHKLGVSGALSMHDVYSLHDQEMLAFVPRPALALLLVFPVSERYEEHRRTEDENKPAYEGAGEEEPVVWFRQTIRNACGMMGLLHAVYNGPARSFIEENSTLDSLLKKALPLPPGPRSALLEQTPALAQAHEEAATQGATPAPDAQDDVDLHYVTFVKASDGSLWELDGRRRGPIRRGILNPEEDVLSERALGMGPLRFLEREGGDLRFSCVALAGTLD